MILTDDEINMLQDWTIGNYIEDSFAKLFHSHLAANERIRELKARLRELAEATEWREQCKQLCAWIRLGFVYLNCVCAMEFNKTLLQAEADYYAALAAAKGK
jgi:hypothetical protein